MSMVKIVTDSNAQLTPGVVERLGIHVVPLRIQQGKRISREGVDVTAQNYFSRLERSNTLPVDLPPPQQEMADLYTRLHRETDQILSLHLSARINDTCGVARAAAANLLGRCRITILDSQMVSFGLGILVEAAAEAAAAGTRLDEVVRLVRGMVPHLYGAFFVETLGYLERSRQISKAQALLGTMLGIKPLLTVEDGELLPAEKVHTRERAAEKLAEFISEFSTIHKMAILQHGFNPETETLLKHLHDQLPNREIPVYTYSPSLACHLGPSAIGVIVYEGQI